MGSNDMESRERKLPEGRVVAPKPLQATMEQVFNALLSPGALDGLVVVAPMDHEESIKEGLRLVKEDPSLIMILWVPPHVVRNMELYRDLQEGPKLKLVRSMNLLDIIAKITESGEQLRRETLEEGEEGLEVPQDGVTEKEGLGFTVDQEILKLSMGLHMRVLGTLRHDLKPWVIERKDETYQRIIAEARKVFGIKDSASDEQVVDFIVNSKPILSERFKGKHLEELFCDLDDTLLMRDGTVNMEVLAIVEKYEEMGLPPHIWTGGDVDVARAKVKGTPLERFAILSKHDYAGATAEIVIDNVSVEKFVLQYGIKPKKFVRV